MSGSRSMTDGPERGSELSGLDDLRLALGEDVRAKDRQALNARANRALDAVLRALALQAVEASALRARLRNLRAAEGASDATERREQLAMLADRLGAQGLSTTTIEQATHASDELARHVRERSDTAELLTTLARLAALFATGV